MRLLNRRFVPFYFDLSDRGFAGDTDAREFVTKKRRELAGRGVPTPPVLIMTPDGDVVDEASNYGSPDEVLAALRRALEKKPDYNRPGEAEQQATSPVERANILIDLQDLDGARKVLGREEDSAAHYLLGSIARAQKRWADMEKHLAKVTDKDLADDVQMERAYPLWYRGRFEELEKHLARFPRGSNRYTEAQYYRGLALHHLDRRKQALDTWKRTIKGCSEDPWIYRADWAYTQLQQGRGQGFFSSAGPKTSLLNRIGYMGRGNPDLDGPPK
jgi:tetratricopeptide (TPR) repeat protein